MLAEAVNCFISIFSHRVTSKSAWLTLINPPSGSARRNAGCGFIFGFRFCRLSSFLNVGTGPLRESPPPADCGGRIFLGDRVSRPKTALSCAVAELG